MLVSVPAARSPGRMKRSRRERPICAHLRIYAHSCTLLRMSGNDRVKLVGVEVLADDWYVLRKVPFDWERDDGTTTRQSREAYARGNGATILLYAPPAGTVLLTRQF